MLPEEERPRFCTFIRYIEREEVTKLASTLQNAEDVQKYIDMLIDFDNDHDTVFAVQVLIYAENPIVTSQLILALQSEHIGRLKIVIELLGERGAGRAVEQLINLLHHENFDIRTAAACSLSQIGDKRAVEPIIICLQNEEDEFIQGCLAQALGFFEDEKAVPVLIDTFMRAWAKESFNDMLVSSTFEALGIIGGQQAREFIAFINEHMEDFDKSVQKEITFYLQQGEIWKQNLRLNI